MARKTELDYEITRTKIKIEDVKKTIAFCAATNNKRGLARAQDELFRTQSELFSLQREWRSKNAKLAREQRIEKLDRELIDLELRGGCMTEGERRRHTKKKEEAMAAV